MTNTITTGPAAAKVAGIDIGKTWLDIGLADGTKLPRRRNDADGIAALMAELKRLGVVRVGFEATGGYERALAQASRQAGFETAQLQPAQVRGYARYRLKRAKSDSIDRMIIAECTADLKVVRGPPDPRLEAFAAYLTVLEQTEEDIARSRIRRESAACAEAVVHHKAMVKLLLARRREIIKSLEERLRRQADLAGKLDLMVSVKGIGPRTALSLAIRMPELGSLSREEAASLLGVAPVVRRSGKFQGEEHVEGGRARARTSLFACAQAAIHHNPQLKAFYSRLRSHGKHHSVAIMACTRKLIVLVNAILARNTPWQPDPPAKQAA